MPGIGTAPQSKRFGVTAEQYKDILNEVEGGKNNITNVKFSDIGEHAGSLTLEGDLDVSWIFDGVGSLLVTVDEKRGEFKLLPSLVVFDEVARKIITVTPPPPSPGHPNIKVKIRPPFGPFSGYDHVVEGSLEKATPATGVEPEVVDGVPVENPAQEEHPALPETVV